MPVKADLPITRVDFFAAAERRGLRVIANVSVQNLKVVTFDEPGPVLRFFAPDLRVLPEGTQINGAVGLAVRSVDDGYRDVLFHHILNLTALRQADRLIQQEAGDDFFPLVAAALQALPSEPSALAAALQDDTTWIGRELKWGRSNALSFERRVAELVES
jgi:hypothetical protein